MRTLFCFVGGNGHFQPLVPIAQAARAVGHTVAFCCGRAMAPTVEAAGFTTFPTGQGGDYQPQRRPLLPLDAEREDRDLERIARVGGGERAVSVHALCRDWRADLVVCDEVDFGSMIAAERLGLAHAAVLVIAAGSFVRPAVVAQSIDEVRTEYGLSSDPQLQMLSRYLVLSPFPPSLRDPAFPLPATGHSVRLFALDPMPDTAAPPWITELPEASTVYFTLGTVFNMESGDLFQRVLAGLRDLPINVVMTVGKYIDPEEFGPQPPSVRIERYIPQSSILPHCSAVISHAGSGSVMGALAHGLPMVLIPMGADQPLNAARCENLGVARMLDPIEATPESVKDAVSIVLRCAEYRRAAERLRGELANLPGPAHAVELLERLAAEKRPLRAG